MRLSQGTMFKKISIPYRSLWWVMGVALALRLATVMILPTGIVNDSHWYLRRGALLVTNTITINDLITFGPGYAVMAGIPTALFGQDTAVTILRILQTGLGALVCGLVWQIAHRLTNDSRVATAAGLGIALNPIFIIENNNITSENLFILLLVWGLWLYIKGVSQPGPLSRPLTGTGVLLGMATLTRAMLLLYPFGLVIHLVIVCGWKRALRGALVLLLTYAAVVSTWTIYNLVKFDRLIIGADGMSDFLLMGVVGFKGMNDLDATFAGQNNGSVPTDQQRSQVATNAVSGAIRTNPAGYVLSRVKQLAEAVLQPHQTTFFGGESLKDLAIKWFTQDRSVSGLVRVINGDAFWPKLSLYIAHYLNLIFGVLGMLLTLRQWRIFAPLSGLVVYTLLLHFFLLAVPRYLLPMTPILWVFAAIGMVRIWEMRLRLSRRKPLPAPLVNG